MSDDYESDPHDRHNAHGVNSPQGDGVTDVPNDGGGSDSDSSGGDSDSDGLLPHPVTAAPQTGDPVIDEALAGLEASARSGDLDTQVEAGERVHRELQERLDDLGGA